MDTPTYQPSEVPLSHHTLVSVVGQRYCYGLAGRPGDGPS